MGISESIGNAIKDWIKENFDHLITSLNAMSPEIITGGVIICAIGMMVGPVIGSSAGKWFGRMNIVFWGGVIWRLLIV